MDAQRLGIGIIYQELDLFPNLSAGNIAYKLTQQLAGAFLALGLVDELLLYFAKLAATRTGAAAKQYQLPDGKYYQLPWKSNPVMIFYNKDLLKKAGVDVITFGDKMRFWQERMPEQMILRCSHGTLGVEPDQCIGSWRITV